MPVDPNYADAYYNLAHIYEGTREYLKALENYKKAGQLIAGGPELIQHQISTGFFFESIGDFEKADNLLKKAIQAKADESFAYQLLAWSLTGQGRLIEALEIEKKIVTMDSSSGAWGSLGDAYAFVKDFPNAWKYWQMHESKVKKTGAINLGNYHRKGYILWNLGRKEEARKCFNDQINILKKGQSLGRGILDAGNYDLAATYAFVGEGNEALRLLRIYDKEGFTSGTEYYIMSDPLFENLRSNPEFKEIVSRAQAKKTEIRKRISELEKKQGL